MRKDGRAAMSDRVGLRPQLLPSSYFYFYFTFVVFKK